MTVPSCDVTPAMLADWGFVLQGFDTKGMTVPEARHAAWVAGLTHVATRVFTPGPGFTPDAEMMAWGLAQKGVTA